MGRPVSVAVTGGIGAGKSEALQAFNRHGAAVVSSDEIVHRLLAEDADVRAALRERLGEEVFDGVGRVVWSRVAELVFGDPGLRAWLEQLLHPRVMREYLAWSEEQAGKRTPPALTVAEVPLLYETGGDTRFDRVVVITAPLTVRAERHPVQDEREARLLPDEEKVQRADYAYVNDGSLEELDRFVAEVVEGLSSR
ncbi:MAG: dephospho-CoA kinase [Gaiellaceae bacterium]